MNSPLLKDYLNTWLRATKILSGEAFNTLVGTKSKPALSLFFNFSKILEISEGHEAKHTLRARKGRLNIQRR